MAATVAVLGTPVFTTTAGNKTITATPTNGDLIVIVAAASGVATTMADNATGGTYTQVGSTQTGFSTTGNLQMFVRDNLVTGAASTIYTATQTSSTGGGFVILRVTGMTLTGAAAVRSSGGQSTVAAGTPAPVLSKTPLSTNPIITAMGNTTSTSTTNVVQRTGYTEDFDNGYNTPPTGLEVSHLNSGETSATLTYGGATGSQFASIAVELDAAVAPTVTTAAASSILGVSATGNGNVTSDGGGTISSRGFCWSTSANPTTADPKVVDVSTTTGSYSDSMTRLTTGTAYHYRAYAINEVGTSYGADTTFTTNTSPTVALNTPADTATGVSTTPELDFTGTDTNGDTITYEAQIDTVNTFDSVPGPTIDSYSETNTASNWQLDSDTTVINKQGIAQSFTGTGAVANSATLYLSKVGSPTGNAVVKIYAHSGVFGTSSIPTGAALATSNNFDVSTLTTSNALYTISFPNGQIFTPINGTNYLLSFEYSGGDSSNYVKGNVDNTSPTHPGNTATLVTATWTAQSANDMPFYLNSPATPLIDATSASGGHDAAQFVDKTNGAHTDPFTSGEQIGFTVPVGETLTASTTYYWRARGLDPSGSNTYGAWPTTQSFTTASASVTLPAPIIKLQAINRSGTY